ncbi:hypothetical protein MMC17_010159 [Xylographa soralifera]|nr:hypothetical protein [Xylographa soralifera]
MARGQQPQHTAMALEAHESPDDHEGNILAFQLHLLVGRVSTHTEKEDQRMVLPVGRQVQRLLVDTARTLADEWAHIDGSDLPTLVPKYSMDASGGGGQGHRPGAPRLNPHFRTMMVLGELGTDGGEDVCAALLVEMPDDDKTLRPGEGLQAQCDDD